MKKLFAAVLLAGALCLGLAGCAAGDTDALREPEDSGMALPAEPVTVSQPVPEELPDPEPVWTAAEGAAFSLLQDTYPAGTTQLTLVVENQGSSMLEWGAWELYEKYVDGHWRKLEGMDEIAFRDVLFCLEPLSVRTQTLVCLKLLPYLEEGLYRVTGDSVFMGGENMGAWQVSFRVAAEAQPEPDYALHISNGPVQTVDGCLVADRLPVYFINTTGEDGYVLDIPHLEKQDENGAWAVVPWKEGVGFCGTPSRLCAGGRAWSEELGFLWGFLDDGRYRLSYQVGPTFDTEKTIYGEFTRCTPERGGGLPLAGQN